jgi:FtsP/CotA-like multicopper oxidase with cupredoxin domain
VSNEPAVDDGKLPPLSPRVATGLTVVAVIAMLCLTLGIALATVGSDGSGSGAALGAPLTAHVGLSEFKIDPASVEVAKGGVLHVQNDGTVAHNLSVVDSDLKTPDLAGGEANELDISSLAAGSYQLVCLIPGHADAGMKADLEVVDQPAGAAAPATTAAMDHGSGSAMDYEQMTKDMLASMNAFPAATDGAGNEPLQPSEVKGDGTKVFDLVAKIVDWEVSPGKTVKAWTYNGQVPAPTIRIAVGDRVEFRLKNELPVGTDLHLHGLNVDNRFDGVAPYTQDLIEPGDTFTYEYTADEVAVAMYHPHFMSQIAMPNGMFGAIFVGDEPLPLGRTVSGKAIPADVQVSQRIPMVLNDSGVIGYSLNGKSFPATAPVVAQTGEWIEITYFNEGTQVHPMHLHQFDQIVIAEDGFPLDQPFATDVVTVAPGERFTVLVKLDKPGTWVWHCHILPHVENDSGMFGMVTAVVVK